MINITEKRFYCDASSEYRGYGIFDLSKVDKEINEFRDEYGLIESWGFGCYLVDETDSMMTGEKAVNLLNQLHEENISLKSSEMEMEDYLGRLEEKNKKLKKELEKEKLANELLSMGLKESEHGLWIENQNLKQSNKGLNSELEIFRKDVVYSNKLINKLHDENEELKRILGDILLEVKREISNSNNTEEIRVWINPKSFDMVSEVLKKYGALKEWYE